MHFDLSFILHSILFGIGLAMDAFSVSLASGLSEPDMPSQRSMLIAGTFGFFQTAMPLIGWLCIHTIAVTFQSFQKFIPWIALLLLLYIGGKMFYEGFHPNKDENKEEAHTIRSLFVLGIATSIDALSVGFTIADYDWRFAFAESLIIGIVTFGICCIGLFLGRKLGTKLARKATILGGVILILIGIKMVV